MLATDASGDAAVGPQSPVGEKACATAAPVVAASPASALTSMSVTVLMLATRRHR